MFTILSMAILPNVEGIAECLQRFHLYETHSVQTLAKEDVLLYQLTEQFFVTIRSWQIL
jgi:hypothetical protein